MIASVLGTMIRFGTSGWRGIVGEEFTFRNVRLVLEGTITVLRRHRESGEVLVSYDTRLLSEKFAREAIDLITHHGLPAVISERDLPSPCLASAMRERGACLGVMFTASHNPPEYNGLKLYTRHGTLASRGLTDEIEAEVARLAEQPETFYVPRRELASASPLTEGYLASLERDLDWEAIRRSHIVVAVDPLWGTAREFLDRLLLAHGVPTHVLHTTKDPYFGGYSPECTPNNLGGLREKVRATRATLGLATDGDGDRFGVVDETCRVLAPNLSLALLVEYLFTRRKVRGGVGRTIATTRLVDRAARAAGCDVVETPVGFHHFGELFIGGRIAVATEESAGLGVASHLPERDGIYAALLVAEMVAVEGRTVRELLQRMFARYGPLFSRRIQLPLRERIRVAMEKILARTYRTFAGSAVLHDRREDGLLLELEDDAWVLIRPAGTEPKLRLYAESPSANRLRVLLRECRRLVREAEEGVSNVRD